MAKKKSASFNMSETIREILTNDPKLGSQQVTDAILAKHPDAKINKGSFNVAYYTTRKKLGLGTSRGNRVGIRTGRKGKAGGLNVDMSALQSAAKLLREAGSIDAAMAALKTVQTIQLK